MPRRPASALASVSSASPSICELKTQILKQPPSKESLDAVAALYNNFMSDSSSDEQTIDCLQDLDATDFLKNALWPLVEIVATAHYHVKKAWLVSVLLLVSFRAREMVALSTDDSFNGVWNFLMKDDTAWKAFTTTLWTNLMDTMSDNEWTFKERTALTQFLITSFQSFEVPQMAASVLQMTSISLWTMLSPTQRALEFQLYPKLEQHWNRAMTKGLLTKAEAKVTSNKRRKVDSAEKTLQLEQTALVHQLDKFFKVLKAPINEDVLVHEIVQQLRYVALFLALLIDLLSQSQTRRYLLTVLRHRHIRTLLDTSALLQYAFKRQNVYDRQALRKQVKLLDVYIRFPIDAKTNASLSPLEQRERQTRHIQTLQQYAFLSFRNSRVEDLAVASCGQIADALTFTELLGTIAAADRPRLSSLAIAVGVLADQAEAESSTDADLIKFFVEEYSLCGSNDDDTFSSSIYPTEMEIWNELFDRKAATARDKETLDGNESMERLDQIYSADDTNLFPILPVRKLGLQYINLTDYFQRNYELIRLEAARDIRRDLETAITQLDAVRTLHASSKRDTRFRGFSRFAVSLSNPLQIVQVSKPSLGQNFPASVVAQFEVELSSRHDRHSFDSYQSNEVVFLVTIRAIADEGAEMMGFEQQHKSAGSFPENYGVLYVRAGEILEVQDVAGNTIHDENPVGKGSQRVFKVALDGVQYKKDLEAGHLDAYENVNLLVRRDSHVNNFKAVLDTVASAWQNANSEKLLPTWLHDLFLGYGDPATALYKSIYKVRAEQQIVVPLGELLQDGEHALDAGGGEKLVRFEDEMQVLQPKDAVAPFAYVENVCDGTSYIRAFDKKSSSTASQHTPTSIRYTKAQVAAVRTGQCEGLTLVVGPPGTGKTDVVVQLVLNLYRTTPAREKILLVAHSNRALDNFLAKVLNRNVIHEAELVRLGQAQHAGDSNASKESGSTSHANFSRNGRVAFLLKRRAALLTEVEQMAQWLINKDASRYAGLAGGSASYSCENAQIFYQFHMKPFLDAAREADNVTELKEFYAMRKGTAPDTADALRQFAADIESYFAELRRLHPFELLQTPRQRGDMYMIYHARIVATTCTYAASNHRKLTKLKLTFGSLIMQDATQISEVDSLVPLLLACTNNVGSEANETNTLSSLKRVVLLGDAKQLPPVAKSLAFANYAHSDQSLFTRLLRLGVPHITLDYQGRCRSELADIYRWRYENNKSTLGDLPQVKLEPEYQIGNAGFAHVAQFVDLTGASIERQLKAHAHENVEEAKFIVALFWYMIGVGYRPDQVTILTTCNAQKELFLRLLNETPGAKMCHVSTVDDFQGQENDFVLLSTVLSGSSAGHLQDVRRVHTAFSRARLGLYVVGCLATLEQSRELKPFLTKLVSIAAKYDGDKATKLALVPSDRVGMAMPTIKKTKSKTKVNKSVYVADSQQLERIVAGLRP